jgi:hypothetical protein
MTESGSNSPRPGATALTGGYQLEDQYRSLMRPGVNADATGAIRALLLARSRRILIQVALEHPVFLTAEGDAFLGMLAESNLPLRNYFNNCRSIFRVLKDKIEDPGGI